MSAPDENSELKEQEREEIGNPSRERPFLKRRVQKRTSVFVPITRILHRLRDPVSFPPCGTGKWEAHGFSQTFKWL